LLRKKPFVLMLRQSSAVNAALRNNDYLLRKKPFVLSLSKEIERPFVWFDELTTNGLSRVCILMLLMFVGLVQGPLMAQKPTLKKYQKKRDFAQSPEPQGGKRTRSKKPLFVIQKHAASHLHYDVRLEIDGVLVSWAVPKGPSNNPGVKRLAIQTEDHPMEYAHFEGVIPAGNYGAGTVMVWDKGTYKNLKKHNGKTVSMKQCLRNGQIEVFLRGKKVYGGYALIKTARGWLLIKMRDEFVKHATTIKSTVSAKTGRTMQQIKGDE
jgi:bifunctional non-homologous end joining protein LigD